MRCVRPRSVRPPARARGARAWRAQRGARAARLGGGRAHAVRGSGWRRAAARTALARRSRGARAALARRARARPLARGARTRQRVADVEDGPAALDKRGASAECGPPFNADPLGAFEECGQCWTRRDPQRSAGSGADADGGCAAWRRMARSGGLPAFPVALLRAAFPQGQGASTSSESKQTRARHPEGPSGAERRCLPQVALRSAPAPHQIGLRSTTDRPRFGPTSRPIGPRSAAERPQIDPRSASYPPDRPEVGPRSTADRGPD